MNPKLADWQLPAGVSRATWDYVNDARIATEYDSFHASHRLLQFDQQIVNAEVDRLASCRPATIVDLGCGTGRSLAYAHQQGHKTIGVDLSTEMLRCAAQKMDSQSDTEEARERAIWIHANMVETDMIASDSADLALCMYSSLGMVRGAANRLKCLTQANRFLKSQGKLIVHVHNRRNWWRTAAGRTLILKDFQQRLLNRKTHESGDRYYVYRNLPSMFLHIFTRRELQTLLRSAGFQIERWIYLDQSSTQPLTSPWFMREIRSAGFLVIAMK